MDNTQSTAKSEMPKDDAVQTDPTDQASRKLKLAVFVSSIVILVLIALNGFLLYQFANLDTTRDVTLKSSKSDNVTELPDNVEDEQEEVTDPTKDTDEDEENDNKDYMAFENEKVYQKDPYLIRYPSTWEFNDSQGPDGASLGVSDLASENANEGLASFSVLFGLSAAPPSYSAPDSPFDPFDCSVGFGSVVESEVSDLIYRKVRNTYQEGYVIDVCVSDDGGSTFTIGEDARSIRIYYTDDYSDPETMDTILEYFEWDR